MKNRGLAHSKDLRKHRIALPNQVYLVTTVTYERLRWFEDFFLGRIVVNCMRQQQLSDRVESLAFVVMPDHFHWLLVLQPSIALSDVMRLVKGSSSRWVRECLRQRGLSTEQKKFWQDGFHDYALRKEEDVKAVARYVIANPLRAGLVRKIGNYPLWDAKWVE